jgi:predicted nucleic acid-binding protein
MPTRAFLDSNVFIFGYERPKSNSRRILDLLGSGEVHGVVTDRVVHEVMGYFRRHHGKDRASKLRDFILLTCELALESDLEIGRNLRDLVGPRDAGAVAATRTLGLAVLVSTDSDFAPIPERLTPKAFLQTIRERPLPGDE